MFVNLSENENVACDAGAENLSLRYGRDMREVAEKYLLCGSLDRCAETIELFQRAGVSHFIFKVAAPVNEEAEHMTRLAEGLLPMVRNP
jgi:alkanesulfonate monooxygenase SsuD/methylene tetrahydromethanopterin reductase-like flavin-dependent oxidoreductase (luciferase family)